MARFSVISQSGFSGAARNAFAFRGRGASGQRSATNRSHRWRLGRVETDLRLLLICCFSVILSGCGAALTGLTSNTSASASPTLSIHQVSVQFGNVLLNTTAAQSVTLTSSGSAPVTIDSATVSGSGFALTGASFPLTLDEGQTVELVLQFLPVTTGQATGQLKISSNSSTASTDVISLSGTGAIAPVVLNSLSCGSAFFTGSGTDSCQVTLSGPAPSDGLKINLASNNSAVTLPAAVTVPANASSAEFTAAVAPVTTAQAVAIAASQGSASAQFALELNAAVPALRLSAASLSFGNVQVNTPVKQSVVLTSTGTARVTINGASLAGRGFSLLSVALPVTLSPGQSLTLTVQFDPTATGAASGQLTIASNSSTNGTTVVGLSGTGTAAPATLSLLSCASGTLTGAGTDACTASLTAAAPSGGLTVKLSSSNSAVKVPSTLTVPAGAASVGFTATVASVTTSEAVTITASVGSMFTSYTLQLNATIVALSINPASVAFGNVVVNTPATESVTLTSTGSAPVTIQGATLTGAGFTVSGPAFPITLPPAQQTTLDVEFDPTSVGTATGKLTISSSASANGTAVIGLTGTGAAAVAVAVTPTSASISPGGTQQFSASVTGTSNTAVTWMVTGTGCSGAACGTISSNGLYTAPATVPSPAAVTITATSVLVPAQSASSTVTIVPNVGTTYYLAPAAAGGNDSNNGLSAQTPWLTPNHSVNCGDVITAASGNYALGTFAFTFGTVTGSGHCFAFLKCATFDSCYVNGSSASGNNGIFVSNSHWAVMGFEVTNANNTTGDSSCFKATTLSDTTITDVAFINDIANGCGTGGFISAPYYAGGPYGVDYFILIADIAYNAAQTTETCASGVSVWEPVNYDTLPGTHTYVAQYFGWDNVEPSVCAGAAATDGEGVIFDTFSQYGYTGQTAVEDSLTIFNGSHGIEAWENAATPIYIENNTTYANNHGSGLNEAYCGEIDLASLGSVVSGSVQISDNIAQTNSATGCGSNPNYAYFAADVNSTDVVNNNVGYSASAYNAVCTDTCTGFSFGPNNTFGTNPGFAHAPTSTPAAPSCGSSSNVIACMAPMVADFVPQTGGLSSYGYQPPSSTPNSDPLFPQWLCQYSNQLQGLVTMGCAAQ